MPKPPSEAPITALLRRWREGDRSAEQPLAAEIYPILRDLARSHLRRNPGLLTLRTTELANEAYLRLAEQQVIDWQNRDHFFAIAATVMRRVVVDYIRMRTAEKRGGQVEIVQLESNEVGDMVGRGDLAEWLDVDRALTDLARDDPDTARVIELRLFSGLTTERIAEVCGTSVATVGRQWRFARAWLSERLELSGGADGA